MSPLAEASETEAAELAGSASCRECHGEFHEKWATSWHSLSVRPFTSAGAASELVPPVGAFRLGEESYRVELEASRVVVTKAGEESKLRDRSVAGWAGGDLFSDAARGGPVAGLADGL